MITQKSLELFKLATEKVSAYQKFLAESGFNYSEVTSAADFSKIPITSKKNYLQKFPHKNLVWQEDWHGPMMICSTSGSTGEPYYFPRNESLSVQASIMAETFLKNSSHGISRTLVILGFGMGVWIGGELTLRGFELAVNRMHAPVSILPTGYNKKEVFKALKKLAPEYEQTIIAGYPPFIKQVIDEAETESIDLSKLNIRLMFAAEAFTETFRNYVAEKAGIKNTLLDTLNIYGTADIGAMAHETPVSILIRKIALEDPLLFKDMFGQIEKTPTLAQYNPEFIEFETVDNEVILTANNALPLIRYAVGDHGGAYTYNELSQMLGHYNINLEDEIVRAKIKHTVSKRPFVFVYERTDLSITLHGIIVYPEFIKEGLLDPKVSEYFTERFTMSTKHDIHHNQFIQINIELQNNIEASESLQKKVLKAVSDSLKSKSSEYAEVAKSHHSEELIQIVLWPYGHPRYFTQGIKQKWVENT